MDLQRYLSRMRRAADHAADATDPDLARIWRAVFAAATLRWFQAVSAR